MRVKLFFIWRILLVPVFIFTFVHLAKDVTQDILHIKTPLDLLGDAKEDLSMFPKYVSLAYTYGLGIFSLFVEVFILFGIIRIRNESKLTVLGKLVFLSFILLVLYITSAVILDPRY